MLNKQITLRFLSLISICLTLSLSSLTISAYDNKDLYPEGTLTGGAHRLITQIALTKFSERAKADSILSQYNFYPNATELDIIGLTSIDDISGEWTKTLFKVTGMDIQTTGQTMAELNTIESENTKTFEMWLVDGGFSADEPEKFMSWRHFYNPTNLGKVYLTDLPMEGTLTGEWIQSYVKIMGEPNPQIDARSWALAHPDNPNSWLKGMDALDQALSGEYNSSEYAHAWRSIGQTLHSMADMSVPAHVRNDSHPGNDAAYLLDDFRSDAYEYLVSANSDIIIDYKDDAIGNGRLAEIIKNTTKPSELFYSVAYYVSTHFFSTDTIPYMTIDENTLSMVLTDNNWDDYTFQYPDYTKPQVSANSPGQYVIQDEKGELLMYQQSWLNVNGWNKKPGYVNKRTVESQAARLIPIAIESSIKMLDLSMPRISIDNVQFDKTVLKGQVTNYKRQSNGSYLPSSTLNSTQRMMLFVTLEETGKTENFLLPPMNLMNGGFELNMADLVNRSNLISRYVNDDKSIKIQVGLDLGGILIQSKEVNAPSISVNPVMESIDINNQVNFSATVVNAPEKASLRWTFNDGSSVVNQSETSISYIYEKAGYYIGSVALIDPNDKNHILAQAEFGISVSEPTLEPDPSLEQLNEDSTLIEEYEPDIEVPIVEPTNPDASDTYDYAAALAKWTSEFKAEVDARLYHDETWGCDCTYVLIYDVTPYIKFEEDTNGGPGIYWSHHIDQTCVYFAGQFQGQTIVGTVNSFSEGYSAGGQGMGIYDLRAAYPEFQSN